MEASFDLDIRSPALEALATDATMHKVLASLPAAHLNDKHRPERHSLRLVAQDVRDALDRQTLRKELEPGPRDMETVLSMFKVLPGLMPRIGSCVSLDLTPGDAGLSVVPTL
jgi:hypothetical protein